MKRFFSILLILALTVAVSFAADTFTRSYIQHPDQDSEWSGVGNIIAGVDFDGDGMKEIFLVNHNMYDADDEMFCRMWKMEEDATGEYKVVWETELEEPFRQNTWAALAYGDIDKDGKTEIYWGPPNWVDGDQPNPSRILVFEEAAATGSDVWGVDDGLGSFVPNATWSIVEENDINLRPLKWEIQDVDADGTDELIYVDRVAYHHFGVVSVSDIPDEGDGTEVWTLEGSALGSEDFGSSSYDMAILNNMIYLFCFSGDIHPFKLEGGVWTAQPKIEQVLPGGSWVSAEVVDIDGDGAEEIVVAEYAMDDQERLMVFQDDGSGGLTGSAIVTFNTLYADDAFGRPYGCRAGDIDQDGKIDFIIGSRGSTPYGMIHRVEYKSGDITDPNSYEYTLIDSMGFDDVATEPESDPRMEPLAVANIDSDPQLEVIYTSRYGQDYTAHAPLVVLNVEAGSADSYTVTFRLNTSTAVGTIDETTMVQVRGGTAPLTWGDDAVDMVNVGGDYWEAAVTFAKADLDASSGEIQFKFWFNTGDGEVWESTDNKTMTVTGNMTTDLFYFNKGTTPPYTATDDCDVWFRVFMKNVTNFDPAAGHTVSARGSKTDPSTNEQTYPWGGLDWDNNLVAFTQEGTEGMAANFWSGLLSFPAAEAVDAFIEYKFVTDLGDGNFGWESISNRSATLSGNDTTLQWVYWDNIVPTDDADTIAITYVAAMATLVNGGWFNAAEDTIMAPGSHNWGADASNADNIMEQDFDDPTKFVVTIADQIAGEDTRFTVKFRARPEWKYADHGWEGNPNREWFYGGTGDTTLEFVPNLVGLYPLVEQDMTVRFKVDMRNAGRAVDEDTVAFNSVERVFVLGSWMDADSGLVYSGDFGSSVSADSIESLIAEGSVYELFDDGSTNGDDAAGDGIWTAAVSVPQGSFSGWLMKIGCLADGITDSSFTEGTDGGDKHGFNFQYSGTTDYTHNMIFNWITKKGGTDVSEPTVPGFNSKKFTLTQNYPNPFNPSTTFKFNVPEKSMVEVSIYNINGEKIEVLYNNWANIGTYTVKWNADDLASGVYIYKVRIGDEIQSKKMMLLR